MDLAQWEAWLDHSTGTRREAGSLQLLIDGERFFPRLQRAISEATNHIHIEAYIFDKDDVAVGVADKLKRRSRKVEVKVILDQMGSLASGMVPPATPLPEKFVGPASITSYLRSSSHLRVHPFLNPLFSADHSKLYLVDGMHAWLGGMNLGREYRYEWHDLMVELTGPVVASLEAEFQRAWAHEGPLGGSRLRGCPFLRAEKRPIARPIARPTIHYGPIAANENRLETIQRGGAGRPWPGAELHLSRESLPVGQARERRSGASSQPRCACARGPAPGQRHEGGWPQQSRAGEYLLEHGVRGYFYPGMTHVKALPVDDWACLGSGNLNHLSLRLCQEQNLATSDPAFAGQLRRQLFDEDFIHSYELTKPITIEWNDFLANFMLEGF